MSALVANWLGSDLVAIMALPLYSRSAALNTVWRPAGSGNYRGEDSEMGRNRARTEDWRFDAESIPISLTNCSSSDQIPAVAGPGSDPHSYHADRKCDPIGRLLLQIYAKHLEFGFDCHA